MLRLVVVVMLWRGELLGILRVSLLQRACQTETIVRMDFERIQMLDVKIWCLIEYSPLGGKYRIVRVL